MLEKPLPNNFVSSDVEDNTSKLFNREGIADLPLLRMLLAICQKSWEPGFWEMMDPFVLVASASLAAWRTILHQLLACVNFTLNSKIYSVGKNKKRFIWTMAAAKAAENHGVEWDLTWYLQWGSDTNSKLKLLSKFTSSSRRAEFKGILPWNISQIITETIPITQSAQE